MQEWTNNRKERSGTIRITSQAEGLTRSHCKLHSTFYSLAFTVSLLLSAMPSVFGAIEVKSIEFGFGGHYKRSRWVPLHVLVVSENEPTEFIGEIVVKVSNAFSGAAVQTYSTPFSLTRTDRQRRVLYIFQPGTSTKLTLTLVQQDGRVQVHHEIIPDSPKEARDLFILTLTPSGLDVLDRRHGQPLDAEGEIHTFVGHAKSQNHLPAHWKGYDSIDLFVMRNISLAESRISKKQQTSLLDWVQNGGTLLISGGSNLKYLRNSFLESHLPVYLGTSKTVTHLPERLVRRKLAPAFPIDIINFTPKRNGQILISEGEQIFVSSRSFGSGQIICLAFDYNLPPFSQLPESNQFWTWLLKSMGKSRRHFEDQYEPHRRDAEKIHQLLTSLPAERAPLIRMLALFVLPYLLSVGGFTWWAGKHPQCSRAYWISCSIITVFFSCAAILPRIFLPTPVSVNRFSILSVYSESSRAHLQAYMGIIASADSKPSIQFSAGSFITPLTPTGTSVLHRVEARNSQLREANLNAWQTRGYSVESFFDFPQPQYQTERNTVGVHSKNLKWVEHHLSGVLQNAGIILDGEYTYLESVPPNTPIEIQSASSLVRSFLSLQELAGKRKKLARILASEGVLQYLPQETAPKLVGWMEKSFLPMELNNPVEAFDETFVILYLVAND